MQSETSCLHGIWPQWTGMRGLQKYFNPWFFQISASTSPHFRWNMLEQILPFPWFVFLLNLRQKLNVVPGFARVQVPMPNQFLQARYLVAPAVVLLWDTMKYWSRMAGSLVLDFHSLVWTIVPHASHRWAFGIVSKIHGFCAIISHMFARPKTI